MVVPDTIISASLVQFFGNVMLASFLLILGLFAALYLYYRVKFQHWKNLGVPYLEPSFPMGNLGLLFRVKPIYELMRDQYIAQLEAKMTGVWTLFRPCLIVRDLELIKRILTTDFEYFNSRGLYHNEQVDPLSANITALTGERWKFLRSKLSPTLSSVHIKQQFSLFLEAAREFVQVLENPACEGEVIDARELSARFLTDLSVSTFFGMQAHSLRDEDSVFRAMGKKLMPPSLLHNVRVAVAALIPRIAKLIKMRFINKELSSFIIQVVGGAISTRQRTNTKGNDVLQLMTDLMEHSISEGSKNRFTFTDAAASSLVFFAGGYENAAITIQFALYELALNRTLQERTRNEILRILEGHNKEITYEAIQQMDHLERVLQETLRKYPPLPVLIRECTKDYKVPGEDLVIEKGTQVQIITYAIHHDSRYYTEPEKFDEDRFTEQRKAQISPYAYLPFGQGPRICPGVKFAMTELKVGVAALLVKYNFQITEDTDVPITYTPNSILLTPQHVKLRITKINH